MIKAVLDTNVVVSSTISSTGNPYKILKMWEAKKFILITSKEIVKEAVKVLHYPKIQRVYHLSEADIKNISDSLLFDAQVVKSTHKVKEVRDDPADNKFLEAAIGGNADFIVTGNEHLLRLKNFHGTEIVPPRVFLHILKANH